MQVRWLRIICGMSNSAQIIHLFSATIEKKFFGPAKYIFVCDAAHYCISNLYSLEVIIWKWFDFRMPRLTNQNHVFQRAFGLIHCSATSPDHYINVLAFSSRPSLRDISTTQHAWVKGVIKQSNTSRLFTSIPTAHSSRNSHAGWSTTSWSSPPKSSWDRYGVVLHILRILNQIYLILLKTKIILCVRDLNRLVIFDMSL